MIKERDIPADVMARAREVQKAIRADRSDTKVCTEECSCDKFCETKRLIIARAILAERERCAKVADNFLMTKTNVIVDKIVDLTTAIRSGQ